MSATIIMQLAAHIVKGERVTVPALTGKEFAFFLDSLRELRSIRQS